MQSPMKTSRSIRRCLLAGAGTLLLLCGPVLADEGMSMPSCCTPEDGHGFDWIQHTRHTLTELKGKLNLAAEQSPAWETWSGGVIKDAHQQLESRKDLREEKDSGARAQADATTPEQMARGIQRLHAQIDWMQQHLVQLEAAQARTGAFYDTLDINQRTIFDLFWHEMYHRAAGHDDGGADEGHGGSGPGRMRRDQQDPADGTEPN